MTHEEVLAIGSSILNFLGGTLLVIGTFSPERDFLHAEGEKKWNWLVAQLRKPHGGGLDSDSPPVNDHRALRAAKRSQCLTRTGFIVVTLGFLLDLLDKLHMV